MDKSHEAVFDKLDEVKAYRGHELYAHFVHLLGLIDEAYDGDFRSVSPETLKLKQGGSLQCRLLREELISQEAPSVIPKV